MRLNNLKNSYLIIKLIAILNLSVRIKTVGISFCTILFNILKTRFFLTSYQKKKHPSSHASYIATPTQFSTLEQLVTLALRNGKLFKDILYVPVDKPLNNSLIQNENLNKSRIINSRRLKPKRRTSC